MTMAYETQPDIRFLLLGALMNNISQLDAGLVAAVRDHIKRLARHQPDAAIRCPLCSVRGLGRNLVRHYDKQHGVVLQALSAETDATDLQGVDDARWLNAAIFTCIMTTMLLMALAPFFNALPTVVVSVFVVGSALPILTVLVMTLVFFDRRKTTLELNDDHIVVRRWPWGVQRLALPLVVEKFSPLKGSTGNVLGPEHNTDEMVRGGLCLTLRSGTGTLKLSCRERSVSGFVRRWQPESGEETKRVRRWPTVCRLEKESMLRFEVWLCRHDVLVPPITAAQLHTVLSTEAGGLSQGLD